MNSGDIKDRVRSRFGDSIGVQVKDADLIHWINDGQRHIVKENSGLLEVVALGSTTQGVQEYGIESLAASIMKLRSVRYKDRHLKFMHMKEFNEYIDGWDNPNLTGGEGIPQTYSVFAGKLILFPIPQTTEAGSLKLYYTRYPVDVDDLIADKLDLPLSYHNALLNYVLQQAYEKSEDWQGHGTKASEVAADLAALKDNIWAERNAESYQRITTLPEDW